MVGALEVGATVTGKGAVNGVGVTEVKIELVRISIPPTGTGGGTGGGVELYSPFRKDVSVISV